MSATPYVSRLYREDRLQRKVCNIWKQLSNTTNNHQIRVGRILDMEKLRLMQMSTTYRNFVPKCGELRILFEYSQKSYSRTSDINF